MCGGFVSLIQNQKNPKKELLLYHLGRLFAYAALGAAAGFVGGKLNRSSSALLGLNQLAALLVTIWFLYSAIRTAFPRQEAVQIGQNQNSLISKVVRSFVGRLGPGVALGISSALLPCGWLYSNIILAAAPADPIIGAVMMTAFWLGTVPALQGVAIFSKKLRELLPTSSRVMLSIIYLSFAAYSLYLHSSQLFSEDSNSCHHHEMHH